MSTARIVKLVAAAVGAIAALVVLNMVGVHVGANEITVVQAPLSGNLRVIAQPGYYCQCFGTVTTYTKREQFSFSAALDQGKSKDEGITIRFNDGGHAKISGVISWEMPTATDAVIKLHTLYGSMGAVEQQLVRPAIERSVYLTGPLMSSTESYGARRAELLRFIEDQARDGVYQTETINVKINDPITGQEKTVQQVKLLMDGAGIKRQGASPIRDFSISLLPPSINQIVYDTTVESQIKQQQEAVAKVQIAQAQSREAEQRALTAEKNGQADAAKAKWEQETIKAREVTAGQQRLAVAQLDTQAAEQEKRAKILRGEGDASARQLAMSADGALDKKLDAVIKINGMWATAFQNFHGQVVPTIVNGATVGGGNAALSFMEVMSAKAARDLAVDLQSSGADKTHAK